MNSKLFFEPYSIDELKALGWEYSAYSNTLSNIGSGDHVVIIKSDLKIVNLKPYGNAETTSSAQTGPFETFKDALEAATKMIEDDIIQNFKRQTESCVREIFKKQNEINRIAKKAYPPFDPELHQVSREFTCERSPIGYCIYKINHGVFYKSCVFCEMVEIK